MNITTENVGNLESIIKIQLTEEDYQEKVNKSLKNYRKNAALKGFRKGMVPMGLIKKLVGKSILVEEINKIVSHELIDYLKKEEVNFLGEPLPSEKYQSPIDWETQTDFEFVFDIGMSPEFDLNLNPDEDKVPYYIIQVSDKMIDDTIDSYKQQNGEMIDQEVTELDSSIVADFAELDAEGNEAPEGISAKEAKFLVRTIKDEEIQNMLIGANKQQMVSFNIKKAFPNDSEISSMLNIEKEEASEINADFQITITDISKYVPAEDGQPLYDKVFGEGTVSSEEEFRAKIKETIEANLVHESEYKYQLDAKDFLLDKIEFDLPADFLKRWIEHADEKLTKETIEKDWSSFEKNLKWQIISSKIANEKDVKVLPEDLKEMAIKVTKAQFQQYGIPDLGDEQAEQFSHHLLENEEQRKNLEQQKYDEKIFEALKELATLNKEEISHEDFAKLFEPKAQINTEKLQLDKEALEDQNETAADAENEEQADN